MTTLGFIGSGKIGGTVARISAGLGHPVVVSNSRAPETLSDLVGEITAQGGDARAAWAAEASAAADVAMVSIPLKNIWDVDPAPLAGKIVLETNNYYPARDGRIAELDEEQNTTTGLLQDHLPESHVVKIFNHINWKHIPTQGLPAGDPNRRAIVIASAHADALDFARDLLDRFGFDAVEVPVAESWRIERDTPGYGPRLTAAELTAKLAEAERAAVHS